MDPLQLLHGAAAVGDPNPMKRRWLDDALLSVTPWAKERRKYEKREGIMR